MAGPCCTAGRLHFANREDGAPGVVAVIGCLPLPAVGGIRLELGAGGHAVEGREVGLHLGPQRGVFLCGDGRVGIGVVGLNVTLEARGNGLRGLLRETMEQEGIGRVGERIAAGRDDMAGIEVAIRERMVGIVGTQKYVRTCGGEDGEQRRRRRWKLTVLRGAGSGRRKARKHAAQDGDGERDAMHVVGFGCGGWSLDVDELEGADLGQNEQQCGDGVAFEAGFAAIGLPVVFFVDRGILRDDLAELGGVGFGRLMAAVKQGDGIRNAGNECAHRKTVARGH